MQAEGLSSVAEWMHFTLFEMILPTTKLKVCTFLGLMISAIQAGNLYPFGGSYNPTIGEKVSLSWARALSPRHNPGKCRQRGWP